MIGAILRAPSQVVLLRAAQRGFAVVRARFVAWRGVVSRRRLLLSCRRPSPPPSPLPPLLRGELGGSAKWGRRRSARDRPVLAGWLVWTSDDLDCCCAAALFSLARASSSVGPRACLCVVRRCRLSATSPGAARRRDGQPSRPGPRRGESALVSSSKNRPRRLPRSAPLLRRVLCCTWSVLRCRV